MNNLIANWPAPKNISALTTTRLHGASTGPYSHNNLALHVDDEKTSVLVNRTNLTKSLNLPGEPVWLNQIHSNQCVVVEDESLRDADASVTRHKNMPLVIMTADCLPILLCNQNGNEIAAVHAGWRGLLNGVIENTLLKMNSKPESLLAWIGPAICKSCFEIGEEVEQQYIEKYPFTHIAFRKNHNKRFADLPLLAKLILNRNLVSNVTLSNACTFEESDQYYSYRKEAKTGRIATLIWFNHMGNT